MKEAVSKQNHIPNDMPKIIENLINTTTEELLTEEKADFCRQELNWVCFQLMLTEKHL